MLTWNYELFYKIFGGVFLSEMIKSNIWKNQWTRIVKTFKSNNFRLNNSFNIT